MRQILSALLFVATVGLITWLALNLDGASTALVVGAIMGTLSAVPVVLMLLRMESAPSAPPPPPAPPAPYPAPVQPPGLIAERITATTTTITERLYAAPATPAPRAPAMPRYGQCTDPLGPGYRFPVVGEITPGDEGPIVVHGRHPGDWNAPDPDLAFPPFDRQEWLDEW